MSGPLAGVRVLELAGIGPGPFAGMMLADMGAQVTRVDRIPDAKATAVQTLLRNDGYVDRGRRSIAINTKEPRGVETVLRLVERSDILIEGFRPGVTEKLGLGPAACHARNPRLVYGRMTGWGQTGSLAQAAGHDLNYIALTGALHAMGPKDRPPAPPLNLVGDYGGGGMLLALGVVAALFEARQSGRGQVVDAAMTDGTALLMAAQYGMLAKGAWNDQRESNFLDGAAPFYGSYECADGRFVAIGPIEPQFYRELLQKCGIEDPQFTRQWERAEWPALRAKLAALFRTRSRDQWCALLEGSDACFAPVLSMAEAPQHPQMKARGTFIELDGVVQPAPAPRFSRTQPEIRQSAGSVDKHPDEALHDWGFSAAEVAELHTCGSIG
jgi:alpha-methylacyl-CoA racemase